MWSYGTTVSSKINFAFWTHSLIIIKCDWGKFFSKTWNWITPTINDIGGTYSKSSLKLWIQRKYTIGKKGILCLVAKTLKEITNHSVNVKEVFPQHPISFKANASLYSNIF